MDEEVFSQKDHELKILQNQIKTLIQENEEQLESLKKAEETHRLQVFFLWHILHIFISNHPSTIGMYSLFQDRSFRIFLDVNTYQSYKHLV